MEPPVSCHLCSADSCLCGSRCSLPTLLVETVIVSDGAAFWVWSAILIASLLGTPITLEARDFSDSFCIGLLRVFTAVRGGDWLRGISGRSRVVVDAPARLLPCDFAWGRRYLSSGLPMVPKTFRSSVIE